MSGEKKLETKMDKSRADIRRKSEGGTASVEPSFPRKGSFKDLREQRGEKSTHGKGTTTETSTTTARVPYLSHGKKVPRSPVIQAQTKD